MVTRFSFGLLPQRRRTKESVSHSNREDPIIEAQSAKNIGENGRFQTGKVAGIALAHFFHDIFTSFISPVLPLLIQRMGLSLTQAGSLTVFMQLPSLFNPFLGAFCDRKRLNRLFLVFSPALTATLMCLAGLAPNYIILAMVLLAAGVSIAAIHVSAPVMVARLSGSAVGRGTGMFMLGGELARTAGPLVAVWAASTLGLEGLWKLIPVGLAASGVLWWRLKEPPASGKTRQAASFGQMLIQMRRIITGVFGILVARAFMAAAITTYLPTYLFSEGHGLWLSGVALSIVELAGAAGVFLSGTISDFVGRRKVLFFTILLAPLMMLGLIFVEGVLLVPILLGLGFFTIGTGPVLMAVMLENSGANQAAANGTFMAISFAVRALIILLVGMLSDHLGMRTAFLICAGMAFLGLAFIRFIPDGGAKKDPVSGKAP